MTRSPGGNKQRLKPPRRFRFSLWYLVVFTAIVATWTSAFVARQKNLELRPRLDTLVSLSGRLEVVDPNELVHASLPKIADDFEAWDVHVPAGKPQELRLHCGHVSNGGLPQEFESGPLSPGRHRVVLRRLDSAEELFRYEVYVDGQLVIEKQMGSDWMPKGWQQASGCSAYEETWEEESKILGLTGRRYLPKGDFGRNEYFDGDLDRWSTELGYLLWIDEVGRSPKPIDAFLSRHNWNGIGHRDGLRLDANIGKILSGYGLMFKHPAARLRRRKAPVLNVELEFLIDQKVVLSNLTGGFTGWELSDFDPAFQSRTAFLQGVPGESGGLAPLIELQWTKDRPNEIGFRLPKLPANKAITSWRLRCNEGISHLWRIIESGDLKQDSRTIKEQTATDADAAGIKIELADPDEGVQSVQWRTDIKQPLQIYERKKGNSKALAGITLYDGLPFQFGCEFSELASPKVWATSVSNSPGADDTPIIGGSIFDEVVIELDAADPNWVWLRAEPRN